MIRTFEMKLPGTRKTRSWVAYPGTPITIQSDDAIAKVGPDDTGWAIIKKGGAYFVHLAFAKPCVFPAGTYQQATTAQPTRGESLGQGIYST